MSTKRPDYPKMRGIEAFLSSTNSSPIAAAVQTVPIAQILMPKKQPRQYFDPTKMAQLVESVRQHGILEPLLVRPVADAHYELVAGERRYRAAQVLKLTEVPVVIRTFSDQDAWQVALIENLQRDDLNPVEETEGLLELIHLSLGLSNEEAIALLNQAANAKRRGQQLTDNVVRQMQAIEDLFAATSGITPESFRSHRLPLLNLPADVLAAVREGQISYTKAKAIARLDDPSARAALLETAIAEKLSLSQIQAQVQQQSPSPARSPSLKQQFKITYQQLQQSPCWDTPKHQKRLKKLIAQMEDLLSDMP